MKKILFTITFLFIISCRSSPESSFINLKEAFINWYFRYNPIESTKYSLFDNHGNYKLFSINDREEYNEDLSRFLIELSQIDKTKLNINDQVDYKILYSQIQKMIYLINHHREYEWNPSLVLKEVYYGLYLLCDGDRFDMDVRVNSIQSRLKYLPELIMESKNNIIEYSGFHLEYSYELIDKILMLLIQLPIKIYSDNITLDKIDLLINKSVIAINDYKDWLSNDYKNLKKYDFPYSLNLINNGFRYFIGEQYFPTSVYDMAKNKLNASQNRLFNICLPTYLVENDEPIWLDRNDTLEVISWTIQNISNNKKNKVSHSNLLSYYYNSIVNIEKYLYRNSIINHIESNSVELDYSSSYSLSITPNFLFDHQSIRSLNKIKYNISYNNDESDKYNLVKKEIDILNAKDIIPGRATQLAYAHNYASVLSNLFPNCILKEGWREYSVKMLIDEGFGDWHNEYHILKLKEEIISTIRAITEYYYYSNKMSKNDILEYYMKMGFINKNRAQKLIKQSEINYLSGTQSFVGLMEMYSIRREYKRRMGEDFNLEEFHTFVLKNGIIAPNEIKKQYILN